MLPRNRAQGRPTLQRQHRLLGSQHERVAEHLGLEVDASCFEKKRGFWARRGLAECDRAHPKRPTNDLSYGSHWSLNGMQQNRVQTRDPCVHASSPLRCAPTQRSAMRAIACQGWRGSARSRRRHGPVGPQTLRPTCRVLSTMHVISATCLAAITDQQKSERRLGHPTV